MLPLEHLSASSISLFLRCPRQWQEAYIRGVRGSSSSSLVIGSAVHLGLSRILKGEEPGNFFDEAHLRAIDESGDNIIWKDTPQSSKKWAEKMLYVYYERVGKYLDVKDTEVEMLFEIPGADIPLLGYIDIETNRGMIDVKTTGYVNRKPTLQNSWKLQMNIYQLQDPFPGEFHVITRSSTVPVVVPDSPEHPFYVETPNTSEILTYVGQIYSVMQHYYEKWGEETD